MFSLQKDLHYIFDKNLIKAQNGQPYSAAYIADCYMFGWGIDRDTEKSAKYYIEAAKLGDARSSLRVALSFIYKGDSQTAISYLENCKDKNAGKASITNSSIRSLLELLKSNPSVTSTDVFNSFIESDFEDDYFIALSYLVGVGCSQDVIKASTQLLKLAEVQLENLGEMGVLATQYEVQILLWQCIYLLDPEKDRDLSIKIDNILKRVTLAGDHSLTEEGNPNDPDYSPNKWAGYYEHAVVRCAHLGIAKCKYELCQMYGNDLKAKGESDYPTYHDITEEAMVDLANKGLDITPILLFPGMDGDKNTRITTAEILINRGKLAEGYCLLYMLYDENKEYQKAFKYLKQWSDLEQYDGMFSSATAQCSIGEYYFNGTGVKKDFDKSVAYLKKAALKGNDLAQDHIDKITEIGKGNLRTGIELLKQDEASRSSNNNSRAANNTPKRTQSTPSRPTYNNNYGSSQHSNYQQPESQNSSSDGLSIAALVAGIIGLLCCLPGSIIAIILGLVAKSKGSQSRMATAGLVLGVIGAIIDIIGYIAMNN